MCSLFLGETLDVIEPDKNTSQAEMMWISEVSAKPAGNQKRLLPNQF